MKKSLILLAFAALMGSFAGCSKPEAPAAEPEKGTPTTANTEPSKTTEEEPTKVATNTAKPVETGKPTPPPPGRGEDVKPAPKEGKEEAPKSTPTPRNPKEKPELMEAPKENTQPAMADVDPRSGKKIEPKGPKPLVNYKPVPSSGDASSFKGTWKFQPSKGLKKMQDLAEAKGNKIPVFWITIDGSGSFSMMDGARMISGSTVVTKDIITLHPNKIGGKAPRIEPEVTPRVFKRTAPNMLSFMLNGEDKGMQFKRG